MVEDVATDDGLLGHTALFRGTASRDGTTVQFVALLDAPVGRTLIGAPFQYEITKHGESPIGSAISPRSLRTRHAVRRTRLRGARHGIPSDATADGWGIAFEKFAVTLENVRVDGQDVVVKEPVQLTGTTDGRRRRAVLRRCRSAARRRVRSAARPAQADGAGQVETRAGARPLRIVFRRCNWRRVRTAWSAPQCRRRPRQHRLLRQL